MSYDGYKALAASIFNQAISDYKKLLKTQKKLNEEQKELNEEQKEFIQCKIKENERFFRSEWADYLAECLHIAYNPEKLIEKLRKEVNGQEHNKKGDNR